MSGSRAKGSVNHLAIALGLVLGLGLGLSASATGSEPLIRVAVAVRPVGTAFVNAIQMVVIPLVMVTVFLGVGKLGDLKKLGKLGGISLGLVWVSYIPAIALGIFGMKVGLRFSPNVTLPLTQEASAQELPGFVDFVVGLIPANPFEAASNGSLLPLLVFTILLGAATIPLGSEGKENLFKLAETLGDALIQLVHWILWTAPLGVFALAAPLTAEAGWTMLQSLAVFVITVVALAFVQWTLVYVPAVWFLGRMHPVEFHKATLGTTAIGFGTTSSMASLPVMLEEAADNLELSEEVYPLVLSLLAALNKAGSALFQAASVVFLAHLYDVALPASALAGLFVAIFLVALTVAPVPSASVVTLAPALDTVGVPVAALAILFGVDRIPDMF
ncbi:MAG: dicarboxylate/amino acid:cation symporter, partial [Longimicrobiales bacterium]